MSVSMLTPYALGASVIIGAAIGASLATRVPDEMAAHERSLRVLQAVLGLALLFVLPWWLALVIAGSLALGWLPMAGGLALLAVIGSSSVIAVALPLSVLAGARWVLDKRAVLSFVIALIAFTLVFAALHAIGALAFLG